MTKASATRVEKKAAEKATKKDPREVAKAAQAAKQAVEAANKPAPELTGQEVVQLLQLLENAPTGNRAQRQVLGAIEAKLVAIGVAKGVIHQPGAVEQQ